MLTDRKVVLALDVGSRRIGIAKADLISCLASPLTTINRTNDTFEQLQRIVTDLLAGQVVVGLPRGLDGQTTSQTRDTLKFVKELKEYLSIPIHTQDEAVTSKLAELELSSKRKNYDKGDIDALAATYILEDFLTEYRKANHGH